MSDPSAKPAARPAKKASRWGLFAPILIALVAFGGWSAYWFYTAHRIEGHIGDTRDGLIKAGYKIAYSPLKVQGFPFRMYLAFDKIEVIAPTGKGFSSSHIEAEAAAYALDKWVIVAPEGLTLHRGFMGTIELGTVEVTGDGLRASVSGLTEPVQTIAIEGLNPVFAVSKPEYPFVLSAAQRFEAYLRPTKDTPDSADFLLRVSGAKGEPRSLIGRLGQNKPFDLHLEGEVGLISKFKGVDMNESVGAWRAAGGVMKKVRTALTIDELQMLGQSEALALDSNRALLGTLNLELKGSGDPVGFLLGAGLIDPKYEVLARPFVGTRMTADKPVNLRFDFRDGGTYVGALKLSDAPIVN